MYINVGMANCEKRPKQERDDIRFTHIAIPYIFYYFVILKCVFCWNMYVFRTQVVCAVGVGSKLLRGGSPVRACVG